MLIYSLEFFRASRLVVVKTEIDRWES